MRTCRGFLLLVGEKCLSTYKELIAGTCTYVAHVVYFDMFSIFVDFEERALPVLSFLFISTWVAVCEVLTIDLRRVELHQIAAFSLRPMFLNFLPLLLSLSLLVFLHLI